MIPRDVLGVNAASFAVALSRLPPRLADALGWPLVRMMIGDPRKLGLTAPPYGPMEMISRRGRVPLIDVGTVALLRAGAIRLFPAIARFDEDGIAFEDGRRAPFAAVILATGYRPSLDFLADAPGPGDPAAAAMGLHYCGFDPVATGMLREIGRAARRIAERIARERSAPPPRLRHSRERVRARRMPRSGSGRVQGLGARSRARGAFKGSGARSKVSSAYRFFDFCSRAPCFPRRCLSSVFLRTSRPLSGLSQQ